MDRVFPAQWGHASIPVGRDTFTVRRGVSRRGNYRKEAKAPRLGLRAREPESDNRFQARSRRCCGRTLLKVLDVSGNGVTLGDGMLGEEQIEDFVRDGYAVCRGLIPPGITLLNQLPKDE